MTFESRPLRPQDAGAWADLLAAVAEAEGQHAYRGEAELREAFTDPHRDYDLGSVAFFDGATLVGCGVLDLRNAGDPMHNVRHEGRVHPAYRGRGLGAQVLDWAEHAAVRLNGERPFTLTSSCSAASKPSAALHAMRGYLLVRRFHAMLRDLRLPVAEVPLAPGLRMERFAAERSADALLVRNESFLDHWGSSEVSHEAWAHRMAGESFCPELSFLVYEGADPLGLLLSAEHEGRNAAPGARELYIATVGTRAAGRKRGIATALLHRAMSDARAAGYRSTALHVDADSLTGAVGLYERAGFTVHATNAVYAKSLSA